MSLGYDLTCTTLSQEGKIYQVDYANKAIELAPTVLGVVCNDGVVFVSEKIRLTKKEILQDFPDLEEADIYAACEYVTYVLANFKPSTVTETLSH